MLFAWHMAYCWIFRIIFLRSPTIAPAKPTATNNQIKFMMIDSKFILVILQSNKGSTIFKDIVGSKNSINKFIAPPSIRGRTTSIKCNREERK